MHTPTPPHHQQGVSLLEVLIALLILAVGVLGFAGLQLTSLNQSTAANHRVAAVLIAQDAIERMELNPGQRDEYLDNNWTPVSFGGSPDGNCIGTDSNCSAAQVRDWDIAQLTWQAANQLPGGQVNAIECPANDAMTCVIVSWEGQATGGCINNDGGIDTDANCVVLEVAR